MNYSALSRVGAGLCGRHYCHRFSPKPPLEAPSGYRLVLPAMFYSQFSHKIKRQERVATSGVPSRDQNRRPATLLPAGIQKRLRQDALSGDGFTATMWQMDQRERHNLTENQLNDFLLMKPESQHNHLRSLDQNQFEILLHCSHPEYKLKRDVRYLLEQEALRRLRQLTELSSRLRLTDALYVSGAASDIYMKYFLRGLLPLLPAVQLSSANLLQILFYIGVFRKVVPPEIFTYVEHSLLDVITDVSATQVGLVCHSFFANNHPVHDYSLLQALARKVSTTAGSMPLYMVCNVMKVMHHSGLCNLQFYDDVGYSLAESNAIAECSRMSNLSAILSAYAARHHSHTRLFDAACSRSVELLSNRRLPRMKDVARIVWSCATLQLSVPDELIEELERQLRHGGKQLAKDYPEAYVEAHMALAMVGIYVTPEVGLVISPGARRAAASRSPEQQYQCFLLRSLVLLECPQYKGPIFTPNLNEKQGTSRLRALALHTRQGLAATWLTLEELLGGACYVTCNYITDFTLLPVLQKLRQAPTNAVLVVLLGQAQRWYGISRETYIHLLIGPCGRVQRIPCQHGSDSEEKVLREQLHRKINRQQLAESDRHDRGVLADLLREFSMEDSRMRTPNLYLRPEKQGDQRKVTIKVLSENQYVVNEPVILGPHQLELRALTTMGYEVLVINPYDAACIDEASREERVELITSLILDRLGVKYSREDTSEQLTHSK